MQQHFKEEGVKIIKTINAGKNGSRRLQREWGEKLLCVRYREHNKKIYTTIEIVIDERDKPPKNVCQFQTLSNRNKTIVAIKVAYEEEELRAKIKRHGGKWSKALKLWLIPYQVATHLAIRDRIVPGQAERCPDIDTSLLF